MPSERDFQASLIKKIMDIFPDAIVLKNDPNYCQGIPDLIILHSDRWAALECKKNSRSPRQPNQEYYVDILDKMSYASFVSPENEEEVLHELQQSLGA